MKNLFPIFLFSFTFSVHAVTVEIRGKNQVSLFYEDATVKLPTNLGEITVEILNQKNVPYKGSMEGIKEIYGLKQEMVIVSDYEMKAYGWCFSIDGEVPETMSDETAVIHQNSSIVWYYAYAHYKDGLWIRQCAPDQGLGTK